MVFRVTGIAGGRLRAQSGGIITSLLSLLFVVVFCAVLYFARGPILRFAGESWIVEDALDRADAIIVLSDDNFYADRATRAANTPQTRFCIAS